MGYNPFFWTGVVEDRNDPMFLGRVRVRIVGLHSSKLTEDDKTGEGISVQALPWAYPGMPITSASMNGIGDTPIGPVEGTWVCGIARDGRACQNLLYLWTLPGIPGTLPKQAGFNDTEDSIKKSTRPHPVGKQGELFPRPDHIKEPDTNRLARNQNIAQTIIQTKRNNETKNVPTANGGAAWNEKTTAYAAKYPFNRVTESESGHISEVDDTPGAERLHKYHRTGTFEEIHPDGSVVTKIVADNFEVVIGSEFVNIKGNSNVTIDGNCRVYIVGNVEQQVGGNINQVVGGNVTETVGGNVTRNVSGTYTVTSGGNMKFVAPRIDMN